MIRWERKTRRAYQNWKHSLRKKRNQKRSWYWLIAYYKYSFKAPTYPVSFELL